MLWVTFKENYANQIQRLKNRAQVWDYLLFTEHKMLDVPVVLVKRPVAGVGPAIGPGSGCHSLPLTATAAVDAMVIAASRLYMRRCDQLLFILVPFFIIDNFLETYIKIKVLDWL